MAQNSRDKIEKCKEGILKILSDYEEGKIIEFDLREAGMKHIPRGGGGGIFLYPLPRLAKKNDNYKDYDFDREYYIVAAGELVDEGLIAKMPGNRGIKLTDKGREEANGNNVIQAPAQQGEKIEITLMQLAKLYAEAMFPEEIDKGPKR